jgi:hypothetical protein
VTCSRDGGESAEWIGIVPYDIVHGALGTSCRRLMNVRSSTLDASPNFRQIGHDNAVDHFAETYPGVSLGYDIRCHFDDCGGVGDSHATASEFEQCRVVFTIADRDDLPCRNTKFIEGYGSTDVEGGGCGWHSTQGLLLRTA